MPASSSSSTSCQRLGWREPSALVCASSSTSTSCGPRASTASRSISSSVAAAVADLAARQELEPGELGLGLGAAVGLDEPDDDVDALGLAPARGHQHLVGLADAGRGAEEDRAACRGASCLRRASSSASGEGRGCGSGALNHLEARTCHYDCQSVERQVELQDVDTGLAEHAEKAALGVLGHELAAPGFRQARAPWQRAAPGTRAAAGADVRVEADWPRSSPGRPARVWPLRGSRALSVVDVAPMRSISVLGRPGVAARRVGWRCRAQAALGASYAGSVSLVGRRAAMEVPGFGEALADQRRSRRPCRRVAIRLPLAWSGKSTWAMPVMASG